MIDFITNVDFSILDFIREHLSCGALDFLTPVLSKLGEWGAMWIVIAVVLLFFRRTRRCGVLMLITLAAGFLLGDLLIKPLVARVRPCNVRPYIEMIVDRPTSYSFPSGHATAAFGAATAIFLNHKRWGIAALVFALIVGFSRLYLYVHYPTDVLCGMLLGIGVAIAVYFIAKAVRPPKDLREGKHYA